MRDEALLPCPFCGGEPEEDAGGCSEFYGHEHQDYSIACKQCGAEVYCSVGTFEKADVPCSCHYDTRKVCVDKWNKRSTTVDYSPRIPDEVKTREDHPGWFQSEEEKEDAIKNIQQGLDVVKSRASECWDGIYSAIKGRGKRSEGDFTPDLSMSTEEIIEAINNRHASTTPDNDCVIVKWISVNERLPENKPGSYKYLVFETLTNRVNHDYWNVPGAGEEFTPFWNHYGDYVTHWMPLPTGPKEQDNV